LVKYKIDKLDRDRSRSGDPRKCLTRPFSLLMYGKAVVVLISEYFCPIRLLKLDMDRISTGMLVTKP